MNTPEYGPITICVKIGGSLFQAPDALRQALVELQAQAGRVVVVNGSGPLGACYDYKRLNRLTLTDEDEMRLIERVRGTAAVLLTGLNPLFSLARSSNELTTMARERRIPIADPLTLLSAVADPRAGAEVVAARLCRLISIPKLIVLTNVNGVLAAPNSPETLPVLSATCLHGMGTTCLDRRLAAELLGAGIECVVLNGKNPSAIRRYFERGEIVSGTIITCE